MKVTGNNTLYAQWKMDETIEEIPTGVDGRILPPFKTGDDSNWIEIARIGKYSLIFRDKGVLCWYFSDTNNDYWSSYVRGVNNAFFNSAKVYLWIPLTSTLPKNARLRDYTVRSDVVLKLGSSGTSASLSDGYSKPTGVRAIAGEDVCFALSFTEAANFFSGARNIYDAYPNIQMSPEIAKSNYLKITLNPHSYLGIWLRSPGAGGAACAGAIDFGTNQIRGLVIEKHALYDGANFHPALWVDAAVFN